MDKQTVLVIVSIILMGITRGLKEDLPLFRTLSTALRTLILGLLAAATGITDMVVTGSALAVALQTTIKAAGPGLVLLFVEWVGRFGSGTKAGGDQGASGGSANGPVDLRKYLERDRPPGPFGGAAMEGCASPATMGAVRIGRSRPDPRVLGDAFRRCAAVFTVTIGLMLMTVLPGCSFLQKAGPVLDDVMVFVEDGARILDAIRAATAIFFLAHPAPAAQTAVDKALVDAQLALDAAIRATTGAKEFTQEQFDAAFAQFKGAYTELDHLLRELGIVHADGRMAVAHGAEGEIRFPIPLALSR
jgi:hypothetical protein